MTGDKKRKVKTPSEIQPKGTLSATDQVFAIQKMKALGMTTDEIHGLTGYSKALIESLPTYEKKDDRK